MIKYSIMSYRGKCVEKELEEARRYIVFKEVHNGRGYACKGIFRGTYIECLKYKKEVMKNEKNKNR